MKSNKKEKRVEQLLTCNNWRSQWPSWENGSTAVQPPRGRTGGGGADCVVEGAVRDPGHARGGSGSACWPPPQSRTRARALRAGRRHRPRRARGLRVQAQGRGVLAVTGTRPGAGVLAVARWGAEATRRPREGANR